METHAPTFTDSLLCLPVEVRLMIWRLVLCERHVPLISEYTDHPTGFTERGNGFTEEIQDAGRSYFNVAEIKPVAELAHDGALGMPDCNRFLECLQADVVATNAILTESVFLLSVRSAKCGFIADFSKEKQKGIRRVRLDLSPHLDSQPTKSNTPVIPGLKFLRGLRSITITAGLNSLQLRALHSHFSTPNPGQVPISQCLGREWVKLGEVLREMRSGGQLRHVQVVVGVDRYEILRYCGIKTEPLLFQKAAHRAWQMEARPEFLSSIYDDHMIILTPYIRTMIANLYRDEILGSNDTILGLSRSRVWWKPDRSEDVVPGPYPFNNWINKCIRDFCVTDESEEDSMSEKVQR